MKHVSILALALCITACGGGQSQTFAQEGANKPTPTPTPAPTPTPEPTPTPTPAPPEPGVHYVNGQVLIMWAPPSHRENGDQLTPSEIGGYEVRFREYEAPTYTYLLQKPNAGDAILINYLEGYYEFEVAAFDTNGLYSRFVPVTPQ
ncbi:hypothetical protein [Simiduia agarivorans]|nr:hypothetical protein [Simiduia agarivorans]